MNTNAIANDDMVFHNRPCADTDIVADGVCFADHCAVSGLKPLPDAIAGVNYRVTPNDRPRPNHGHQVAFLLAPWRNTHKNERADLGWVLDLDPLIHPVIRHDWVLPFHPDRF